MPCPKWNFTIFTWNSFFLNDSQRYVLFHTSNLRPRLHHTIRMHSLNFQYLDIHLDMGRLLDLHSALPFSTVSINGVSIVSKPNTIPFQRPFPHISLDLFQNHDSYINPHLHNRRHIQLTE